jgi:hypothetical protein
MQLCHAGRWKLTATNRIGSDSAIIEILVTGVPKSPSIPGTQQKAIVLKDFLVLSFLCLCDPNTYPN